MHWYLLLFVCILICSTWVSNVTADAPYFVSAHDLAVLSSIRLNNELYEIYLSSAEVRGMQKIRVLVPRDYATTGANRRYPVLYLLHGAYGGATDWTMAADAQTITSNASLITVMPNGDSFGWYTNWISPAEAAPQNWRTYHMEKLVPWIDANFRTVATKEGRAIGGLSMGGFGAIRYAQQYSTNFSYTFAFSGALDLLDSRMQQTILNTPYNGKPFLGPFGSPLEPLGLNGWFAQDPITHASSLRTLNVALYTGNADSLELIIRDANNRLRQALSSLNIPLYFNDYGNGQSIGYGCDGTHSWPCWKATLIDVLPRVMAVLQQQ
ncbi:unnamed protein product [Adineta ricciae]|uniref:Esterase family protein n=1 Tax=Adineta ricciae TaxID=249248 RepID=A0A813PH82_ADIRI|nr:unnamed protein product [Adineta ricciae]CAF1352820.1 unnamed protein product [Adineta ricciae]